jgi:hypothetical protein
MHIKSINTLQQHWHAFPKKPYILLCIYLFITSKLQNKHCYLDQNMFNIFGSGETPKRSEIKKKCSKPQNAKISKASFRCCGLGHFDSGHFGFRTCFPSVVHSICSVCKPAFCSSDQQCLGYSGFTFRFQCRNNLCMPSQDIYTQVRIFPFLLSFFILKKFHPSPVSILQFIFADRGNTT